jgi:hypothetical protein
MICSVDAVAVSPVLAEPVQAQHRRVVLERAAARFENAVGQGAHGLSRVQRPGFGDRSGEVDLHRCALEHAVRHEDDAVAGPQHEPADLVRRVTVETEGKTHPELDGSDVRAADVVRRDVAGIDQVERTGSQVDAADQPGDEVLEVSVACSNSEVLAEMTCSSSDAPSLRALRRLPTHRVAVSAAP